MGWLAYGWRGIVLALSVIAFWLLLQFSRSLRLLRSAAGAPIGHVASAVMLNARLARGMRLPEIIKLTGSLGDKRGEAPETWAWRDVGGDEVIVEMDAQARCAAWRLVRTVGEPTP